MAELLQEIDFDVAFLALHCSPKVRGFFLAWKEFKYVNERMPKLRLKSRVNDLISNASELLCSESELGKVASEAKAGSAKARFSLREMVQNSQKFSELLEAHDAVREKQRLAQPLSRWIVTMGHPMRKDFVSVAGVDLPWEAGAEFERWLDEQRRLRESDGNRRRVRRHRLKNNSSKALHDSSLPRGNAPFSLG
jgi:hypothetical protein